MSFSGVVFVLAAIAPAGAAAAACPCLTELPAELLASELYDEGEGCVFFEDGGVRYCYPASYGLGACAAHDDGQAPFCDGLFSADFCAREWCYVDRDTCSGEGVYDSSYFPGFGLSYSYSTCGSANTFLSWFTDGLPPSMTELVSLLESYVVGTKWVLENNYVDVVATATADDLCPELDNACSGCATCADNACWGQQIDTRTVNTALSSTLTSAADAEALDALSCLSHLVRPTYLRTAAAEYDDERRVTYQYYGSQTTGALVQWPATTFCSEDYDARPRPWYASAASGPKDVAIVVDVSGSMSGNRIALARTALKNILGTLTWTDKVNVILFNSVVAAVYSSNGLVEATKTTLDAMRSWVDANVNAGGDTNFELPLQEAYDLLKASQSSTTCSQIVLFMTDGFAELRDVVLDSLVAQLPDVVVFSYKLGTAGDAEPLQRIACATNGLFYAVDDESTLPATMAKYYEYFVQLYDPCRVTWISYTDAITGFELVAGCAAIFDPRSNHTTLIGVNCVDLNLVVSPDQLRTCGTDSQPYATFLQILKTLAGTCGTSSRITDACVLARLRSQIGPDSVCAADPLDCSGTNIASRNESCPVPSDSRFSDVPLDGCDAEYEPDCDASSNGTRGNGGSSGGKSTNAVPSNTVGVFVGIGIAVIVVVVLGLYFANTRARNRRARTSNIPPPVVPATELPAAHRVQPTAPPLPRRGAEAHALDTFSV